MLHPVHPTFFLLGLFCTVGAAQDAAFSCEEPAEVRSLTLEQTRGRLNAAGDDFFLYMRLEHLTPRSPKPGVLAAEFQQALARHPDDPRYLYLYGRSLIGKSTPEALPYLDRAVQAAPDLPWTYQALGNIYLSRNFKNEAKALANIRRYH